MQRGCRLFWRNRWKLHPKRLSAPNICSIQLAGVDDLTPERLEQLRRSICMLQPGRRDGLERDQAIAIIEELQRLQRSDRRQRELVEQLRALLAGID